LRGGQERAEREFGSFSVLALGLGPKPAETTLANHVDHWIAHLVYAASLEAGRRTIRKLI
jgi:hypothetical protein